MGWIYKCLPTKFLLYFNEIRELNRKTHTCLTFETLSKLKEAETDAEL